MPAASTAKARSRSPRRPREESESQVLPDYCARPSCRQPFERVLGPGRPQAFCSEICRRSAEREARQLRSRLAHFEGLVQQLRIDLAGFNRGVDHSAEGDAVTLEARRTAEDAITRVGGVLAFLGDSPEPLAQELRSLHDAVAPLVMADRAEASG